MVTSVMPSSERDPNHNYKPDGVADAMGLLACDEDENEDDDLELHEIDVFHSFLIPFLLFG